MCTGRAADCWFPVCRPAARNEQGANSTSTTESQEISRSPSIEHRHNREAHSRDDQRDVRGCGGCRDSEDEESDTADHLHGEET